MKIINTYKNSFQSKHSYYLVLSVLKVLTLSKKKKTAGLDKKWVT